MCVFLKQRYLQPITNVHDTSLREMYPEYSDTLVGPTAVEWIVLKPPR